MDVYSVTPDQEIGIPETARSVNVDYNTRSGFSFLPCKKKEWMDVPVHTFCQCILERRKKLEQGRVFPTTSHRNKVGLDYL
jgi:hypothetical protein